jgi:hypothetical protein
MPAAASAAATLYVSIVVIIRLPAGLRPCSRANQQATPRANSTTPATRARRVPFDRDKLLRSVQIALRKRPVEPERIEQAVSKIVRELESQGESEISSEAIGEMVMEALRALDDVAYQPNQSAAMQNAASPACTAAPGHIAAPFAAEAIPAKPRTAAAPRL